MVLIEHYFPHFNKDEASIEDFARYAEWARWMHVQYQTMMMGASLIKEMPNRKPKR